MNLDTIVNSHLALLRHEQSQTLLINAAFEQSFSAEMFSPAYWQAQNAITGSAQGRGTTYFVQHQDHHWVLRHYYRGGLIGKLIHDSYLFTGLNNTRAIQEYLLLAQLHSWQLPAPRPIACRVKRTGLYYQADIISERISGAEDLYTRLLREPVSDTLWQKIGETIALFHQKQVYHHDLNIHNILLDEHNKVWLIDFDQGQIKTGSGWQQDNMSRLLRSFNKEKTKHSNMHWQEGDWQTLLNSYQQGLTQSE